MSDNYKTDYYCTTCKTKLKNPKWKEHDEKVVVGYCPRCGNEVSRRLKTK
jgi:predicted RNA-binding Zn-ribbon protein involved in translation (DUF1610 family)